MRTRKTIATFLAAAILAVAVACGAPPRDKLVKIAGFGQQLAAQIEANKNLPETLFEQGVITKERRDFLNEHIAKGAALVAEFNKGMTEVLAEANPDVRSLVSVAAQTVAEVQALSSESSPEWKKALAVIEVSLQAIASYFAAHVAKLRSEGVTDEMMARRVNLSDLRAVEAYAGR